MTREEFQKVLPELVASYRPALDVVDRVGRLNLLMVVGPSGAGKTTLINRLPVKYVPSDNTRPPRPGEKEGVDFYFRTDFDQVSKEIKGGRFVQVAIDGSGDLKATRATSYPDEGDVVMAVLADVVPIFRGLGFARTITAFITPPDYDEWMRRLGLHELPSEKLQSRLAEAKRSFNFALSDDQTHFILSDDLAAAIKQVTDLLAGKVDDAREVRAQLAAQDILKNLENQA